MRENIVQDERWRRIMEVTPLPSRVTFVLKNKLMFLLMLIYDEPPLAGGALMGSIQVSRKLPTYLSPKLTLSLTSH